MTKRTVSVDFGKRNGRIKPLSSAVGAPRVGALLQYDFTDEYKDAAIPAVRVRNAQFPYGANQYVDIHCIFPDFDRDPEDEAAYNFAPTDAYFSAIRNAGAEIFLCLGESVEPFPKKMYAKPPRDFEKWASVCEHFIAHCNEQWANGFKFGIKYCEIFPGADEPDGFDGTEDEYIELYRVVATRLKERFPKLKVGAYSCGGFYSLNHFDASEEQKRYVDYLDRFLGEITKKGSEAPLDFLTWRCVTDSPEELSLHSNYAKSYLAQHGLKRAQSIVSEFNVSAVKTDNYTRRDYPALLASAYIIAQKSGIDMMFYSSLYPTSPDNAIFTLDDLRTKKRYAAYEVLRAFGKLHTMKNSVEVSPDFRRELYSVAAADKTSGAILLATRDYNGIVEIDVRNSEYTRYSIRGILGGGERGMGFSTGESDIPLENGKILLKTGKCEVYFVTFS